jgi:hypothetical protein
MDWKDLAGKVIAAGAPSVGGALFGPLGKAAGEILASVLGVPATPEAVGAAIDKANPDQIASADNQWTVAIEEMKAQAEVAKSQVQAVNETIRAEVAVGDGWLGKWRGIHAWELTAECPFWAGALLYAIFSPAKETNVSDAIQLSGLIMAWWGARFGVLGVHVWQGSNERQAAITGGAMPGVLKQIGKALGR